MLCVFPSMGLRGLVNNSIRVHLKYLLMLISNLFCFVVFQSSPTQRSWSLHSFIKKPGLETSNKVTIITNSLRERESGESLELTMMSLYLNRMTSPIRLALLIRNNPQRISFLLPISRFHRFPIKLNRRRVRSTPQHLLLRRLPSPSLKVILKVILETTAIHTLVMSFVLIPFKLLCSKSLN